MNKALRSAAACLCASAMMFGVASMTPATAAPPGGPAIHDLALWPIPRIPIKPPKFPIGEIRLPSTSVTEFSKLPSLGQTIKFTNLLGKAAVSKEEQAVAKAACRAMRLAFLGTGQRGYWENAILENIDAEEFEEAPSALAINFAADRAASAISAAQWGGGLFKFYLDTCYQKRLG